MATLAAVTNMPALGLVGEDGRLEHSTEPFRRWYQDKEELCTQTPEFQRVLGGHAHAAVLKLDGLAVDIAAVSDRVGARHVLLTLPTDELPSLGDAGGALLDGALDESPAIVWLKDLDGRYVRANSRFIAFLETTEERLLGRTDAELPPAETVDGPRLQERDGEVEEPLQLEYVVGPYQGRDALVVLRFPVGDAKGVPTLVCGVAAPSSQADIARSEAARLLRIERWSRLDAESVRAELLAEWGVLPGARGRSSPATTSGEPASGATDREQQAAVAEARAERATAVAERDAALSANDDLAGELKTAQARLTELERKLAADDAERGDAEVALAAQTADLERALGRERERGEELERTLTLVRGRLGDDAEAARTEVKRARADADAARNELQRARADSEAARADVEKARAGAETALAEALAERDATLKARAALTGELEQERKQITALQESAAAAEGRIRELTGDVERERVRVAGLEQVQARFDKAEGDIEQWRTRAQQAETELARGSARAEGLDGQLARQHTRIEQLEGELKLVTKRADDAERAATLGQARVVALETEVEREQARTVALEGELESGRAKAEEAEATIAELQEQLAELEVQLADLAAEPVPATDEDAAVKEMTAPEEETAVLPNPAEAEAIDGEPQSAAELATIDGISEASQPQPGPGVSWQPTAKRTLAASLARESVWRNVLKETVQVIGSEGGWDTVTAWLPDESDGLGCAATWIAHRGLDRFEALTSGAALKRDGSLLDQALQAPHLTWLTDIDAVDDERLQAAAAHGMSSALLLPVRSGSSTIGLLELLTHDSIEPDAQIALSLEASALQLGRFGHLLSLGK